MNIPKKFPKARLSLCLGSIVFGSITCSGTILVEESFDYTVGDSLVGQSGGTGFSNGWSNGSGTSSTVSSGLTFSSLSTSGGSALVASTGTTVTLMNRTINANGSGTTIWGSYLFQSVDSPYMVANSNGSTWDVRFKNQGGSTSEYQVRPFSSTAGSATLTANIGSSGSGGGFGAPATAPSIYDGSTYLFLSRVQGLGTGSVTMELWIFDEAGLAAARVAGMTDEALTSNVIANGYATISLSTSLSISSGDVLQLANYSGYSPVETVETSYIVDELRYGTTVGDVTPIPEVSETSFVLGIAISAMLIMKRRRNKM
ncbi:MAG: hypothetical protein Q7Q73_08525 [Verrucomicrobiota bacterium JB024]|nr:hypothetical protein [Verrucomicrobiota bacterium JB024]